MDSTRWGLLDSGQRTRGPLWQVDLKLTHLNWSPEATLIHFQGLYPTLCELDYHILHKEIQRGPKVRAAAAVGELCLVEDPTSAHWHRGRVQSRKGSRSDIFLIDHGNVLSVGSAHICSCPEELLELPPKLVCGFLANVLLLRSCPRSVMDDYLLGLVGRTVSGCVQGLLPHETLLLEVPDVNRDLVRHGFGRHVDLESFVLVVELLTGKSLRRDAAAAGTPREPQFTWDPSSWKSYRELLSLGGARLRHGTRVRVRVTAAVEPGLFHCQPVAKERELQEMSKELAELFERESKEGGARSSENLGLLCAVKGQGGRWGRGYLPFLPVDARIRVVFVDYGFFETVDVVDVHCLPPAFASAPIMALPCSLSAAASEQLAVLRAALLLGDAVDMEVDGFDETRHLYSVTLTRAEDAGKEQPHVERRPAAAAAVKPAASSPQTSRLTHEDVLSKLLRAAAQAEELSVGSVLVASVQHAQNPNDFWIQTQKRSEELEAVETQMLEHFRGVKLERDALPNPEPGTLCCAMYEEDKHFYRAVVTEVLEHGVRVLFMDYGNIQKVPFVLVQRMPAALSAKAPFAVNCSLAGVVAFDDWTSGACDFFRSAVFNKRLKVRVVSIESNKVGVELAELDGAEGRSVADLLFGSKPEECFSAKVPKGRKDPTKRTAGTPGSGKSEDGRVPGSARFKASSVQAGCELAVRCSRIDSPSDFWCQSLDQAPVLEELMEKVQKFYSTHTVPLWAGASCCVARSPADGRWYRAVVSQRDAVATALLVDYGDVVQVDEKHLQGVAPEFLRVEEQAFRCSIHHQVEPAYSWNPKETELLNDFVTQNARNLRCQVVSQVNVATKGLCNVVDLYNAQNQQSAAETLGTCLASAPAAPETFAYSSFDLSPGCEELVYVTHVCSQWELYCQLDKNSHVLENLQESISLQVQKTTQRTADGAGAARKRCLAKFLDGNWYRASARPTAVPAFLSVFYVDFGNEQVSEESAVTPVPDDCAQLLQTPAQALRCRLHMVAPTALHTDATEFLRRAAKDKPLRAAVRRTNADGSFDVELFDGDVSLNDGVYEVRESATKTAANAQDGKTERGRNVSKRKASQKKQVPSRSRKKETAKSGGAPQVARSTKAPRNPQDKVPKPSKEPESARSVFPPAKSLPVSFRATCFVSHVNSVGDFYLHLSEDESAILRLEEELNSASFRLGLTNAAAAAMRPGDPVVAAYQGDGALYRGVVVQAPRGESGFDVEFVDYGNTAAVDKRLVYAMPERLRSLPRLSLPCSLRDAKAYQDDDDAFGRAVADKLLAVDFLGRRGSGWEVELEVVRDDGHPQREDAPESKESSVKVPETEAPVGTCALEVPPQTSKIESKKKSGAKKKSPKSKEPFLELVGAFADALTTLNIKAEDRESATVLSVRRGGRFYARLRRTAYLLAVLEAHIKAQADQCQTAAAAEEELRRGLRCLVPAQSGGWKRAEVRRVGQDLCRVFLVDHGAKQDVPRICVRRQSAELAKVADLAVPCRVDGDACELAVGQEVALLFVKRREAEDLWLVRVTDPDLDGEVRASAGTGNVDTEPQRLAVRTDEWRLGFAAAVRTPSSFSVVLGDEALPRTPPLPDATYRCVLRGVAPVGADGHWTKEAAAFFRRRLSQTRLRVFFWELQADQRWKVDVVVADGNGAHVASQLVAAGHARYLDVLLALRFQDASDGEDEDERQRNEDRGADGDQSFADVHQHLHSRWNQYCHVGASAVTS